jgi:hypothetical protein
MEGAASRTTIKTIQAFFICFLPSFFPVKAKTPPK